MSNVQTYRFLLEERTRTAKAVASFRSDTFIKVFDNGYNELFYCKDSRLFYIAIHEDSSSTIMPVTKPDGLDVESHRILNNLIYDGFVNGDLTANEILFDCLDKGLKYDRLYNYIAKQFFKPTNDRQVSIYNLNKSKIAVEGLLDSKETGIVKLSYC